MSGKPKGKKDAQPLVATSNGSRASPALRVSTPNAQQAARNSGGAPPLPPALSPSGTSRRLDRLEVVMAGVVSSVDVLVKNLKQPTAEKELRQRQPPGNLEGSPEDYERRRGSPGSAPKSSDGPFSSSIIYGEPTSQLDSLRDFITRQRGAAASPLAPHTDASMAGFTFDFPGNASIAPFVYVYAEKAAALRVEFGHRAFPTFEEVKTLLLVQLRNGDFSQLAIKREVLAKVPADDVIQACEMLGRSWYIETRSLIALHYCAAITIWKAEFAKSKDTLLALNAEENIRRCIFANGANSELLTPFSAKGSRLAEQFIHYPARLHDERERLHGSSLKRSGDDLAGLAKKRVIKVDKPCTHYNSGNCTRGDCKYLHVCSFSECLAKRRPHPFIECKTKPAAKDAQERRGDGKATGSDRKTAKTLEGESAS